MSIIKNNLVKAPNYTPYCGNEDCKTIPRTKFNGSQFECPNCGWVSQFDKDFIERVIEYKSRKSTHISALRGLLLSINGMKAEDVTTLLQTPLSAFGGLSASRYLIKNPTSEAFSDVEGVFRRMLRHSH